MAYSMAWVLCLIGFCFGLGINHELRTTAPAH